MLGSVTFTNVYLDTDYFYSGGGGGIFSTVRVFLFEKIHCEVIGEMLNYNYSFLSMAE